ncbi:MAG: peptidase [Rhodobiaceae bacterium]|nr:peptidase [Rhodobiaceae bacterium]
MTYCLGIVVRDGLVMIADTRTNAGLDNIATFKKLHVFEERGDRVVALATAGNLSISQSVLTLISEGFDANGDGTIQTINTVPSMFRAAQLVGQAIREVRRVDGESLEQSGGFEVQMLLGGQVRDGRLRLFQIYNAGNFIEATIDTPYLQIGEHKYGKPILDRAVRHDTNLYEALKIGLISMDSTMRSNLGVGMPIDLMVLRMNALETDLNYRIQEGEPYFTDLRRRWSEALREAHQDIPQPPYFDESPSPAESGLRKAAKS